MTLSCDPPVFALTTALPFAAYPFGRWIRGKRFEKECRPLIERIEAIVRTMEADRV